MSKLSQTRLSLLERARNHDEQAWGELVDLYSPMVVKWCERWHLDVESIADCVQEVFASVFRSLNTFHPTGTAGAFRGWLWTITRNKLNDLVRRGHRNVRPVGGSSMLQAIQQVPDPTAADEPTVASDIQSLMKHALSQIECNFEPQSWRAFWRSVVDGLSTEAVAAELGTTPAAVRQSRSRILRRLRQQLGDLK